jgi:hypothetical protein
MVPGDIGGQVAGMYRLRSSSVRDETRAAGLHYFIESLSILNSIDFVKGVFRKGGDVEILPGAGCSPGSGKQSRATLHRLGQQHLCGRLSNTCGNGRNDWIFERTRPESVAQWRESQKHNVLLLAKFRRAPSPADTDVLRLGPRPA